MSVDRWISATEATDIIGRRVEGSVGRAEAILRTAQASGEVRDKGQPLRLFADDGVVNMRNPTLIAPQPSLSESDLIDWLDRNHPATTAKPAARYPGDAALIEEGRRMLAGGMEKRAVARRLAERAEGAGTFESKVDRLRKAL